MNVRKIMRCIALAVLSYDTALAQNPIINSQFTADPTARVFNGKIYLYPSHDIPSPIEKLKTWFCMPDYHVFSSSNLTDWEDHGVIVSQDKVPWVQDGSYTMWAPDCVEKDGKNKESKNKMKFVEFRTRGYLRIYYKEENYHAGNNNSRRDKKIS